MRSSTEGAALAARPAGVPSLKQQYPRLSRRVVLSGPEALAAMPANGSGGGGGDGCGDESTDSVEGTSGRQAVGATCSRQVKDQQALRR